MTLLMTLIFEGHFRYWKCFNCMHLKNSACMPYEVGDNCRTL